MFIDRFSIAVYALFWLVRLYGCVRRARQPLLRGRQWFFNVPVRPEFYSGRGRRILHRYWLRMLVPFAVDVPVATAIFLSHRVSLLNALVVALAALIHINHVFSVDLAEREARRSGLAAPEEPITSTVASLERRRLRDYSNNRLEWTLAFVLLTCVAWLIRDYHQSSEYQNVRALFGVPAVLLYLQLGLFLVKLVIVRWRSPIPRVAANDHIEAQERTRRHYLATCDVYRAAGIVAMAFWAIQSSPLLLNLDAFARIWLALALVAGIAVTIWMEVKRKKLAGVVSRAIPVALPQFIEQQSAARWPVCYQPSIPMLIIRGARGFSLNLANALSCLCVSYVIGFLLLFALLRFAP